MAKEENGTALRWLVITEEEKARVFEERHSAPFSEHAGRDNTLTKIKERFYWPDYYKDKMEMISYKFYLFADAPSWWWDARVDNRKHTLNFFCFQCFLKGWGIIASFGRLSKGIVNRSPSYSSRLLLNINLCHADCHARHIRNTFLWAPIVWQPFVYQVTLRR